MMLADDYEFLTDLTAAQVGDPIAVPPGQSVLPGLYVVTEATRTQRDDNLLQVDLTLKDVRFTGYAWQYSAIVD